MCDQLLFLLCLLASPSNSRCLVSRTSRKPEGGLTDGRKRKRLQGRTSHFRLPFFLPFYAFVFLPCQHHRSREPSRPSFFSGHSSSSSLSLSTEELTEEKRRGVGGGDEKTEERGGAEEEEESEERSMKDWIDSLSSLTKSLSLASPFGGALQTL